jgi:hypothetical protein
MTPAPAPELPPSEVRSLVLTGSPLGLRLPEVCARCGGHGATPLYWEKVVMVSDSEGSASRAVEGVRAPFCAECRAAHEREVKRMSPLMSLLQCFRSEVMIGAVLTGGAAAFFGWKLAPGFGDDVWALVAWLGVVGFFGLIALACAMAAWRATRWRTVPPFTSVTESFTWRDENVDLFEGERHRYLIRNGAFYDALLAMNQDKLWKPGGEQARRAASRRKALYIVFGVAVALAVFWEFFGEYLRREW